MHSLGTRQMEIRAHTACGCYAAHAQRAVSINKDTV